MTSALKTNASLALGTSEVSLIDLTGAYGALANGGFVNAPYAIRRIRTGGGKVLFQRVQARSAAAIPRRSVAAMNDMLSEAVASGTARRAALSGHAVAGKTGTTQDFRDAWFLGYTAHLTAGVWVGNDDGAPMANVTGGSLPAEIWHQIMARAHAHLAPLPLPDGAGGAAPSADKAPHPVARIEADFIAKALASASPEPAEHAPARHAPAGGARGETETTASGRIIVRPPSLQ